MKFSVLACFLPLAVLSGAFALPETQDAATNASKPQCGPRVVSLATGIHLNIGGQGAELNGTKKLQRIEAATPVDMTQFLIAKGELLSDIATGMTLRKYNQAVAPKNNAALPGLAKYAMAQQTEQKLAESLTGVPKHDEGILATLVGDIMNGTKLNEMNLKEATKRCSLGFKFRT